jgi:serine phosphatase RsbU (regulator of sigma subunit)
VIYLSVSRFLLLAVFFSVVAIELKNYTRGKIPVSLNVGMFGILAMGELAILSTDLYFRGRLNLEYPLRHLVEICALLFISFAVNYEYNRLNKKHLRTVVVYYILTMIAPIAAYFLLKPEISKIGIYGLEVILFLKFLINATDKIDDTFEKKEIFLVGIALLFFLLDLFLRLWEGYVSIFLTLSVAGFCISFLSYTIRANQREIKKEIDTRDKEIRIFADITKRLNSTFELEPLLNNFVYEICEILDAYSGALYLDKKSIGRKNIDEETSGEMVCHAIHGFYPPTKPVNERVVTKLEYLHQAIKSITIQRGAGIIGGVYENGVGELLKDLENNKDFVQTIPKVSTIKTVITMPLLRLGKVYGILQLVNRNDGENFNADDFRFAEMIVDQASLAIYNTFLIKQREEKLETDADLKAAQEIQLSLIPKEIPKDEKLDIAKYFSPTKQIGGDYYDFVQIDEDNLGIIIADVSGKGVTGGLIMSVMRTLMRMVSTTSHSPRHVLAELNRGVEIAVKEKHMFITVLYCIFNKQNNVVKICRAGHNPFILCKGSTGDIQYFKPEGIALGIIDSDTFQNLTKEVEVPYEPGDSIFLYTDGVVEEFDENKRMYGEDRLKQYLKTNMSKDSHDIINGLVRELEEFRGEEMDQHDDIAMINIKAR